MPLPIGSMKVRDLFASDVSRDIPPVVYFHEQTPAQLDGEVREYIITGGHKPGTPAYRRVPRGLHEHYVGLLQAMAAELERPGGPELPTVWISGFYGSGKSSFAKLLGLALDGVALPDGRSLAEAWLERDRSPLSHQLHEAWKRLRQKIEPKAVVFDVGGSARDGEHIHAAIVRQVQMRLGYCPTSALVADFELRLERDGHWPQFLQTAQHELGRPWAEVALEEFAEDQFSMVLSKLFPKLYPDPFAWLATRGGTHNRDLSPREAVDALRSMLEHRAPEATLFVVVDEVSQYVLGKEERVDRLRAFASELGTGLRGRVWLLALGQQKLEQEAGDRFLSWAQDRFPPRLRVHLDSSNIRDVVHRRLLEKHRDREPALRELIERHRSNLTLFAYGCQNATIEELVETYPLLPSQVDLFLQITTALRTRSARAQGDDQAIRGLLQLLGELFRERGFAERPVGALVTLEDVYEVQRTALDKDVQDSLGRIAAQVVGEDPLYQRVAKVVALLELIQDTVPTTARLVAECLYDRLDADGLEARVEEALETLRRKTLLGYSEKHGYKVQSSAGEEWERERRELMVSSEQRSEMVALALGELLGSVERGRLQQRGFPWAGVFSDGGMRYRDETLPGPKEQAPVRVDFRYLPNGPREQDVWVKRSAETELNERLVWVSGEADSLEELLEELGRSRQMVQRYEAKRASMSVARQKLLIEEKGRAEDLGAQMHKAVAQCFFYGRLYFRGHPLSPRDFGGAFGPSLTGVATRILPELYPQFVMTTVTPAEIAQLLTDKGLTGPSVKFLPAELGILERESDSGGWVASCAGPIPSRVLRYIEGQKGVTGTSLLAWFGGPPYGFSPDLVKACVAGLLRGGKVKIELDGGVVITNVRDAGVQELFDKDRTFRRASFNPAGEQDVPFQVRAQIAHLFGKTFGGRFEREDGAIADAVAQHFPEAARRVRAVQDKMLRLPGGPTEPRLAELYRVLEEAVGKSRQTRPTVEHVAKHLQRLTDGLDLLGRIEGDLTDEAIAVLRRAGLVRDHQLTQLRAVGALPAELQAAADRIDSHLAAERPWRDADSLTPDLDALTAAYAAERRRILGWQEEAAESARQRVKQREGFVTLTNDQAHQVTRPLVLAVSDTSADAIAPSLAVLRDTFPETLRRAVDEAHDKLDDFVKVVVRKVNLKLRDREVNSPEEVDQLVDEIRNKLLAQLKAGSNVRVRLLG